MYDNLAESWRLHKIGWESLDRHVHHRFLEDFIRDCINAKEMITVVYNAFLGKLLQIHSFLFITDAASQRTGRLMRSETFI